MYTFHFVCLPFLTAVLFERKPIAVGQEYVQTVLSRFSRRIFLQPGKVRPAGHVSLEKSRNAPSGQGDLLQGQFALISKFCGE